MTLFRDKSPVSRSPSAVSTDAWVPRMPHQISERRLTVARGCDRSAPQGMADEARRVETGVQGGLFDQPDHDLDRHLRSGQLAACGHAAK